MHGSPNLYVSTPQVDSWARPTPAWIPLNHALIHPVARMVWPWPSRQPVERRLWAGTANRSNFGFGSNCDLQRPLKYRRFSTRNETFSAERRQSARNWTFRRGLANVGNVPRSDTPLGCNCDGSAGAFRLQLGQGPARRGQCRRELNGPDTESGCGWNPPPGRGMVVRLARWSRLACRASK